MDEQAIDLTLAGEEMASAIQEDVMNPLNDASAEPNREVGNPHIHNVSNLDHVFVDSCVMPKPLNKNDSHNDVEDYYLGLVYKIN